MIQVNLSRDIDYHTQRNNRFVPMSACNVTSAVMWLKANRIDFWSPPAMQEEDYLYTLLESPEAYEKMRDEYPWAIRDGYPPNQVHGMLAWAINKVAARHVCWFKEDGSLREMIWRLFHHTAVIMQGKFTRAGHIVCVVGFRSTQHDADIDAPEDILLERVVDVVVDDPYGNYHTEYSDFHGNDVAFDLSLFDRLTEQGEKKWMHVMEREG